MKYAIETRDISKNYGTLFAIKDISLHVKPGEIYAFLGLNGAGKTTTIRALLGMIRLSRGEIKLLGQRLGISRSGPWGQIGHLVESPSAYNELTVRENLEISRRLYKYREPDAVKSIIKKLSIEQYADRKAGTLSLGNLQRLGLARALLHNPELLILDEPSNALDPAGIVEIRNLLIDTAKIKGKTIFLSSHILSEVHLLADRIGIIHNGRLIREINSDELEKTLARQLVIGVRDEEKARPVLEKFEFAKQDTFYKTKNNHAVSDPENIASALVHAGAPPTHLVIEQQNLEEYFLTMTRQGAL